MMPDAFDRLTAKAGDPQPDLLVGRRVRDFCVLERIGEGAMGSVYKAEHLLLHELRALRVMRADQFSSVPNALDRFQREVRIASGLRHPNLAMVYDFFVEDGHHFLVMEYVAGTSLAALLRERGMLSVEETCEIGIQCCAGLSHAHERGIVHRDLSPENVMLVPGTAGPSVKIIDFGIARAALEPREQGAVVPDAALTKIGDIFGKPRYASPEQAGAQRREQTLDPRSDLYTLGLILYEMTTGAFPFEADATVRYLWEHAYKEPAKPTLLRPDLAIPAALEAAILRCLEKDRELCFATARDLAVALERTRRAVGRSDQPTPAGRRASRRSPLATGAAFAGLAAGVGALWLLGRREAMPVPVVAPETKEATEATAPDDGRERFGLPVPEPPQSSPGSLAAAAVPAPSAHQSTAIDPVPAARPKPIAEPEPRDERETPRGAPGPAAFADIGEMQRAFDEALAFERSHDPPATIANWKLFRSRSPSRELDEQAKRRIMDLTLNSFPSIQ